MKRTRDTVRYIDSVKKRFQGAQKTVRNIPMLRVVERTSHWENLQQEGAQKMKRTALATMSAATFAHEVASPLTGISASLEFLEKDFRDNKVTDPVLIDTLLGLRQEVTRLGQLLKDFRAQSGEQPLHLESSDLRKIIKEVITVQMIGYRTAGVEVEFDFADPVPAIDLDPARIKQAILNLSENAIEAMPKGGRLTFKCYPSHGLVILEIADNGIGMASALKPFELYKTTIIGGSGLGLAIAAQIVSAHNGTIEYTQDPDGGTKFRISFTAAVHSATRG